MREMLSDGRVTRYERAHFLETVAASDFLTVEQKAQLVDRVERWYEHDRGELGGA